MCSGYHGVIPKLESTPVKVECEQNAQRCGRCQERLNQTYEGLPAGRHALALGWCLIEYHC
jgi:hypothetical protein